MSYKRMIAALLMSSSLVATTTYAAEESAVNESQESQVQEEGTTESSESMEKQTVTYNGQTMTLPVGPEDVEETKVTEKTQGEMGERAKQAAARARTEVLTFTLGNTSVPRVDFIDVSSYQPNISVDTYKQMKSKGVKGVVVKLTEGTTYRNPYAKSQINNAKAAGLKVSTYHFARYQNKSQAEEEADYYADYAKDLGLPSSTLMVNDMEASECNNGYATSNSIYFALRLINTQGFKSVLHYGYQNWFDSGVLDVDRLGSDSIWCASYPYTPSKNNLWFKDKYEAWQFSSTMKVSGYDANTFDANIDYTGRFTGQEIKGPYALDNYYMTINTSGKNTFSNTSLNKVKTSTSSIYHKTVKAKRYYMINGKKYYSIYDNKDNWLGYIYAGYVRVSGTDKPGGAQYTLSNQYGTAKETWSRWDNFDFTKDYGKTEKNKMYRLKYGYYHFNGHLYYSIYDNKDNWKGYVNAGAFNVSSNDFGSYHSYNKYVTITKKGYGIFQDKNFKKKVATSDQRYNKTYLAKGYYTRFDGTRYYSIYNNEGEWQGYIRSTAVTKGIEDGENPGGARRDFNKQVVAKDDYEAWDNFNFSKQRGKVQVGKTYTAKYFYGHYNGRRYYSIYDGDAWVGYVNSNAFSVK